MGSEFARVVGIRGLEALVVPGKNKSYCSPGEKASLIFVSICSLVMLLLVAVMQA